MVQNMNIVIVISFIMLIEVSVVVSAFSSFRSITTVSPGLVNLYKAQVVINVMIRGHHFLYQLGEPWCLAFTGVPVLTLTLGGTKARRGRQVSIIIIVRFFMNMIAR